MSFDTFNGANTVCFGDNLQVMRNMSGGQCSLLITDVPFNSRKTQKHTTIKTSADKNGDRVGFAGKTYKTEVVGTMGYADSFDDYHAFMFPRMEEMHRLLTPNGSLYFHVDYREVHYCKVWLDQIFGRENFLNEIIYAWDYGGKTRRKWPAKHQNILWYAKNADDYVFNYDDIDRIPYKAPGLVGPEKAKRGKKPTDTWVAGIINSNAIERTGYPSQKPRKIIDRIIKASSNPGDIVMDPFAGSGTVGESCLDLQRSFILIDNNPEAITVMKKRFQRHPDINWVTGDTHHTKGEI